MTITKSSTRLAVIAASVAVAAGLIGAVAIAPAQAASLSSTQVQAIVNLLQSFGADSATIANVTAALSGQPTSGGSTGGSTAGACPALARDLPQLLPRYTCTAIRALDLFPHSPHVETVVRLTRIGA